MERRAIEVRGVVQGVGFRPFVYALAARFDLRGFVRNRVDGVSIEIEGDVPALDAFLTELATHPPPLARIDDVAWETQPLQGDTCFRIEPSDAESPGPPVVTPDAATCDSCLAELFDPDDRRYRYPFLNCTHCGPRLTIVTAAPYDRQRTTMASFVMCPACLAEYDDPANRRFHAQATCCPDCGPRLSLLDNTGMPMEVKDPLAAFAAALRAGRIGAIKGLGGFHLACDARDTAVVAELRRRKHRDAKPFALMVRDIVAAEAMCAIQPEERALLLSWRRPIVLLRKHREADVSSEVAPGSPVLGVMLPYTPVHHLLFEAMGDVPLVMTSGNRADEPIAFDDDDAVQRLDGIADLFLTHDRPIHVRCDDSVTRVVGAAELPIRRSRGYAPQPLRLPFECPRPILAVGGQLKGTFALGRGRSATLSHHLGDLDHYAAYRAFEKDVDLYEQLFDVHPETIAHDLHPDYVSTRYAIGRRGPRLVGIQHHHAHLASCMAEHGLVEPVIGVTFDGAGYGTDGAIWGGEFLVGDYAVYRRAAHLRYVAMPGGEQAVREPWRMALAHLLDAGEAADFLADRVAPAALRTVRTMIERRFHSPMTSSMGRLFDAVAALLGLRTHVAFEGQSAVELEQLAMARPADGVCYPWEVRRDAAGPPAEGTEVIDVRPLVRAVVSDCRRGTETSRIARIFHSTLVDMIARVCDRVRHAVNVSAVVLSGGVFLNTLLTCETENRLARDGFRVYRHRRVPPNDGGLCLGQLAIAAQRE